MDLYAKKYRLLLKQHGYSLTKPRKVVFEVLYSFGLQTVSQILGRSKGVDRASVYRAIKVLESIGAVNRIPQGFKHKLELSEVFLPHHHHIQCQQCGRQSDLKHDKLEGLLAEMSRDEGYALSAHKVELIGICNKCSSIA